jgi:hypothetical protein
MSDVFRFLAGSPARSIAAEAIDPGDLPYRRNDNFSTTMTYEDGSLAHLLYTALGPKTGLGKERIEVFCDGETYVVDDFKKLIKGSDGSVLWQSSEVDKGHFEELSRFGDAIATGAATPIPFDELIETSAVALHVEDLLHGRMEEPRRMRCLYLAPTGEPASWTIRVSMRPPSGTSSTSRWRPAGRRAIRSRRSSAMRSSAWSWRCTTAGSAAIASSSPVRR